MKSSDMTEKYNIIFFFNSFFFKLLTKSQTSVINDQCISEKNKYSFE